MWAGGGGRGEGGDGREHEWIKYLVSVFTALHFAL